MRYTEPRSSFVNLSTINDGVVIDAEGVLLVNGDSGRIIGGATFAQGGSAITNELGGIIRLANNVDPFSTVAVNGSEGSDQFINAGLVSGLVSMFGGDDVYVDRDGSTSGRVNLGSGDDIYRLEGSRFRFISADGGTGWDKLIIANTNYQVDAGSVIGFEEAVFEEGGNLQRFSGYQKLSLLNTTDFFNFLDSENPLVDVALNGQSIGLQRSSFRSVTGSAGKDSVELGQGARVSGNIRLGSGDDWLNLHVSGSGDLYQVGGIADGGTGKDTLELYLVNGEDRTFDLTKFVGFEALWANSSYLANVVMRVSNATGISDIRIGQGATLVLSATALPDGNVSGGSGGSLVLSAGSTIGRFGMPLDGFWDQRTDIAQADDRLSSTLTNSGTIVGEVKFYIGDDVYDGSGGTVGGTVFGNAGNDTLIGGAFVEHFEGGFGADLLIGGGGADFLSGGAGRDELIGGEGADRLVGGIGADVFRGTRVELSGDTIVDFERGDAIRIVDADLAAFSFTRSDNVLDFGANQRLIVNGFGGKLEVRAAVGSGVELIPADTVRGDINGDGRADILWRNANGALTDWLGQSDGGFVGNDASALFVSIPVSLKVSAVADFNGDGRNDILWRNDNGALTNWLGRFDGGFIGNDEFASYNVPTNWKVAGTGDFNGDGRADILWRHDNGSLTNWLGQANGSFIGNDNVSLFSNIPLNLKVVAVADFNGDGRDDILWRSDSGALTNWLGRMDGGFVGNDGSAFYGDISNLWKVVGTGDFNGDGYDDILWRHDNGALTNWLGRADGGFVGNDAAALFIGIPDNIRVAAVGDYNGDGYDDILWRNDNGALTNWLGQTNGSFLGNDSVAFTFVPSSWHTISPPLT